MATRRNVARGVQTSAMIRGGQCLWNATKVAGISTPPSTRLDQTSDDTEQYDQGTVGFRRRPDWVKPVENEAGVHPEGMGQLPSRAPSQDAGRVGVPRGRHGRDDIRDELTGREGQAVSHDPPGLYLMKDAQGRVIYVGKAKNLRSRAGSYFHKGRADDKRICDWIDEVADVEFLPADSEVDALLMEAPADQGHPAASTTATSRTTSRFPTCRSRPARTSRASTSHASRSIAASSSTGPFPRAKSLRGAIQVFQRIFKFRTCSLDIEEDDPRWRWFRPCLLHSINQCTAPCNLRIDRESYRADIRRLQLFLDGKKDVLFKEMEEEMRAASKDLRFEKAARLRDEIKALKAINLRGNLAKHAQPEVFYVDPRKGLKGLKKILKLDSIPRTIDGVDIAHLGGTEMVGSLVTLHRRPAVQAGLSPLPDQERRGRSTTSPRSARWSRDGSRASRSATSRSPTSG